MQESEFEQFLNTFIWPRNRTVFSGALQLTIRERIYSDLSLI
jgi:hypothetical protein